MAWPDGTTDWDSEKMCIWGNLPCLNLAGQQLDGQSLGDGGVDDVGSSSGVMDNSLYGTLKSLTQPSLADIDDTTIVGYIRSRATTPHTSSNRQSKFNFTWATSSALDPNNHSSVFSGTTILANDPYNDANATYRPLFTPYLAIIRTDRIGVGSNTNRWLMGDSSNDRGSLLGQSQSLGPTTNGTNIGPSSILTPYQEGTTTEIEPSGHLSDIIFGGIYIPSLYYVDRDGTISLTDVRYVSQDDTYEYYASKYQWGFIWRIEVYDGQGFNADLSKEGAYLETTKRDFGYESGGSLFNSYAAHDIYRPTGISSNSSLILDVEDYLYPVESYSSGTDQFYDEYDIHISVRMLLCYPTDDYISVPK